MVSVGTIRSFMTLILCTHKDTKLPDRIDTKMHTSSHKVLTLDVARGVSTAYARLRQVMRSTGYTSLFVSRCGAVLGTFESSVFR